MPPVETAAPAASATESSAPSLAESLGEMFGDFSGGGESPESEDSAAGTTPAEPAPGTEPDPASETAAAADGATETLSDGTTPAAASESASPDDPFKDTQPASYMLNGQPVSVEDIRVFKEGGAVIRPESLPNVLSKLAERDQLAAEHRTAKQQYDTLNRVIEWKDSTGKTYTGAEAAIENRIANAALYAENNLMLPILTSEDLQPYLTTKKVADASGTLREVVIFRPNVLESLSEKARFQKEQIDFATRKHYAGVIAESSKAQPAPLDFPSLSKNTIGAIAEQSKLDASVLTPADHVLLAKQLPANTKDGMASMAWQELVKDRIQLRAEQKTSAVKLVTSITDATKKAQANMVAAARGMKPVAAKPAALVKAPTPQAQRAQNEGDAFDIANRSASRAMRSAI